MSTQKLLRDVRRRLEAAGLVWLGAEHQGNDHLRIRCRKGGREVAVTMSATPRSSEVAMRRTVSRLKNGG